MRISRVFICALGALALSACASSYVLVGQRRPPIAPESVKIYLHPPEAHYEEVALLDTSSKGGFGFTAQGKTNVVIERLKKEAAQLGANGILLQNVNDQSAGSVGTGFAQSTATGNTAFASGFGFTGNINHKHGNGLAIYVPTT